MSKTKSAKKSLNHKKQVEFKHSLKDLSAQKTDIDSFLESQSLELEGDVADFFNGKTSQTSESVDEEPLETNEDDLEVLALMDSMPKKIYKNEVEAIKARLLDISIKVPWVILLQLIID